MFLNHNPFCPLLNYSGRNMRCTAMRTNRTCSSPWRWNIRCICGWPRIAKKNKSAFCKKKPSFSDSNKFERPNNWHRCCRLRTNRCRWKPFRRYSDRPCFRRRIRTGTCRRIFYIRLRGRKNHRMRCRVLCRRNTIRVRRPLRHIRAFWMTCRSCRHSNDRFDKAFGRFFSDRKNSPCHRWKKPCTTERLCSCRRCSLRRPDRFL